MSNWIKVALSEVAEVFNGKTPSKAEQRNEGHPVLKIRDVSEHGSFRGRHGSYVDFSLANKYSKKQVRDGDTLILNAAHNADYVGSKVYRAESSVFGALATGEWLIIRPINGKLDSSFAHHWVTSKSTRSAIRNTVNGIHLYPKDVARLDILLPPISEQIRIAAILDQADALRVKRREALAQLDSLTQAIFIDMFGDLTKNPMLFPVHSLGDICDVRDGTHDSPKFVESGYPLVTTKNLKDGTVDFSDASFISTVDYVAINKRSKVDKGDILMPMIGTIGNPVLVEDEPAFAIKNVALIKFPSNSPDRMFILNLLKSRYFDRLVMSKNKGGTQKFLSLGDIRLLPIPLPPKPLQDKFSKTMMQLKLVKTKHTDSYAELDKLFASLQHRAFRGEL